MIAITGDVHHMSMGGADQQYMDQTEPQVTEEYIDIITGYGLKVTIFVTGKALEEEPEVFRRIAKNPLVEFGGHNYYAFQPRWLYGGIFGKLMGSNCGPRPVQNWEIKKTLKTFKNILGIDIVSWRDHGYRHDHNTYELLVDNGIKIISDEVGPRFDGPYKTEEGLISLPINTLPDHDHLIHGNQTEEMAQDWNLLNNSFQAGLMDKNSWVEYLLKQVEENERNDQISTLLLHPGCMSIVDKFSTLKKICISMNSFKTNKVREIL